MVQQLDELMQHDGDGRDAYTVLEPGRKANIKQGSAFVCSVLQCKLLVTEDRLQNTYLKT